MERAWGCPVQKGPRSKGRRKSEDVQRGMQSLARAKLVCTRMRLLQIARKGGSSFAPAGVRELGSGQEGGMSHDTS